MASSYWIKLYHEILDDPKMGRLSDHTWRRTIELFLIAGESGDGGFLPPVEDMAWRLRTSVDDVTAILQELETVGITSQTDDGWLVCNFATRQDKISNADRQRAYRDRKQKQTYYGSEPRNDDVTTRNADKDIDKDTDTDGDKDKNAVVVDSQFAEIVKKYENEIGLISAQTKRLIETAQEKHPNEWILEAIDIAAKNNHRNWGYVDGILRNWGENGRGSNRGKSPPKSRTGKDLIAGYEDIVEH